MPKLSQYVESAATEYLRETGETDLDARWVAEFFQDGGVRDEYPRQDLVIFYDMVQKALTRKNERAGKQARAHMDRIIRTVRTQHKTSDPER